MNDELANSLDRLAGLNAELANSMGRSSAGSQSQVKTCVCLKAGRLELMAQIVSNTRLPAHPAISGRGYPPPCESSQAWKSADSRALLVPGLPLPASADHLFGREAAERKLRQTGLLEWSSLQEDRHIRRHPTGKQ